MGLITAKLLQKPVRTVIHLRGDVPGEFVDRVCERCKCRAAEFIDQDTRAWCGEHLPVMTRAAERAVAKGRGYSNAECTIHGMDCPKAWSYVFK